MIPDLSRLDLRRTREKTSHARLTSHRRLTHLRVSHVHTRFAYVCERASRNETFDDNEDRPTDPRGRSPTLSRLTTVMGVNGQDVSRHALRIVKADPPASDHPLARETKRVLRTSELPDVQVEPRR